MNKVISFSAISAILLIFASCAKEKFTVAGNITNAKDSILYFENWGLEGPVVLDSVKLGEDGAFDFKAEKADAPEFYRLRITDQIINVSADSTETVSIKAHYPEMAWKYEISGSEDCSKIRELTQQQIGLQNQCILIARNQGLSQQQMSDSIQKVISAYKKRVVNDYIIKAPMSAYAYFALFQMVGGQNIFNRDDPEDVRIYGAVATSWDQYYPKSERTQNLHNITIEGMKNKRIIANQQQETTIDASKVHVVSMLDITLPDNHGSKRALSSLSGHVVLLDFHAFSQDGSTQYEMKLRELYQKYHDRGLEIYQVGIDGNDHFWKTNVAALPWINVYDPEGASLRSYNVNSVPTGFILRKDGSPAVRYETLDGLETKIALVMGGK